MKNLKFYLINTDYIDYLKKAETEKRGLTRVPNIDYGPDRKPKFFCGSVVNIGGFDYLVPISHRKDHQYNSFNVLDKHKNVVGSVMYNYMVPIPSKELVKEYLIDEITDEKYKPLLAQQLKHVEKFSPAICRGAMKTLQKRLIGNDEKFLYNSVDFKLCEQASLEYCKEKNIKTVAEVAPVEEHLEEIAVKLQENWEMREEFKNKKNTQNHKRQSEELSYAEIFEDITNAVNRSLVMASDCIGYTMPGGDYQVFASVAGIETPYLVIEPKVKNAEGQMESFTDNLEIRMGSLNDLKKGIVWAFSCFEKDRNSKTMNQLQSLFEGIEKEGNSKTIFNENEVASADTPLPYKKWVIFEQDDSFAVGSCYNKSFENCTLENLEPAVDELNMVEWCEENNAVVTFIDTRKGKIVVDKDAYLNHLDKYEYFENHSFTNEEFIVPVVRFKTQKSAENFADWLEKEITKDGKVYAEEKASNGSSKVALENRICFADEKAQSLDFEKDVWQNQR